MNWSKHRKLLIFLVIGFGLVDLALPTTLVMTVAAAFGNGNFIARSLLLGFVLGATVGQIGLFATWGGLGTDSIFVRKLGSFAASVGSGYVILCGCYLARSEGDSFPLDELVVGLWVAIFVGLALGQGIFFCFRLLRGWEIRNRTIPAEDAVANKSQFGIRHLLIGTAIVAVLLAIGKTLMGEIEWDGEYFFADLLFLSIFVTVPQFSIFACTWLALDEKFGFWKGCLVLTGLGILIAAVWLFVVESINGSYNMPNEGFLVLGGWLISVHVGQVMVHFGTLWLFRRRGYRLVRRAKSLPLVEPNETEFLEL